ncbi:hypothetical protein C1H46_010482 [Malus baccata]|uniref:Methyltransferase n=1 Tax=Malus baccata TaxID=106549 RepID=A0A540MYT1_MALBA|nr:hypothetical protein C1H46_010482 [Malus baccata]
MHFHHTPYIHGFQRRPPSVPPNLQALQTLTIPLDKTQRLRLHLTRHPLPLHLFLLLRPLASWQHGDTTAVTKTVTSPTFNLPCKSSNEIQTTSITLPLDFNSHHSPNFTATTSSHSAATNEYPRCNAKYSEYTQLINTWVASWGAYPLSRDILTMSFAPRDTHVSQVQFALDRGVPALIGVIASSRLPYPSRAFDMAHCSRCLIPWGQHDRIYLTEVDGVLRPGGYWILSGPPILWAKYWKGWERTKEDLNEEQTSIEDIAEGLCWKKLVEKDDIAIWLKPTNHLSCENNRKLGKARNFCSSNDPDTAWYTKLETYLTPLPEVSDNEEVAGGKLANWPHRLNAVPPRISKGAVEGVTADVFKQDSELWKKRVSYYESVNNQLGNPGRYRNILDMNAQLGGFAAALVDLPVWVMNWNISELDRCNADDILLEMDRILRPDGSVIIRDDVDVLVKIKSIINGMEWKTVLTRGKNCCSP